MNKAYVRAMQELRRSSAARPHRNRKRYGKAARLKAKADLRRGVA